MIRNTSVDAYITIKNNGLLSAKRWIVYHILFEHGPLTGMEVRARLNELRALSVAEEQGVRVCSVTGMRVILWDVTQRLPVKFDTPNRHKCKSCGGKGYIETTQGKLL